MAFYFKNTKKDIIMTEKDEKDYRIKNVCRFCEKNNVSGKVRDHCHLTGKYRGPAHSICINNVTQDKTISYHLYFTTLVIMIVICSFKS